jgi:hypothetical protein
MNDSEKESYIKLGIPTRLQSKHILHNSEMHLLSCPDYDYDFLKMFNVWDTAQAGSRKPAMSEWVVKQIPWTKTNNKERRRLVGAWKSKNLESKAQLPAALVVSAESPEFGLPALKH